MRTGNTDLREAAEAIFTDLGYDVDPTEEELLARRKWRVVHVTPIQEFDSVPSGGGYRCFVTWHDQVGALERRLQRADPACDWAVVGVDEEDYVVRRPTS